MLACGGVERLLARFAGREDKLLAQLIAKYGDVKEAKGSVEARREPRELTLAVKVPAGLEPGHSLVAETPYGADVEFQIPEGAVPGQVLRIPYPNPRYVAESGFFFGQVADRNANPLLPKLPAFVVPPAEAAAEATAATLAADGSANPLLTTGKYRATTFLS